MTDPFYIEGPACISFSGGRTSAYLLWRILQAHGGKLPENIHVLFENTGKEAEQTLAFVKEVGERWAVLITWLQYLFLNGEGHHGPSYEVVNFITAAREGEPYAALIRQRNFLPNPVARFCTAELKIRTAWRYMRDKGYAEWDDVIGIRADEPRRIAKVRAQPSGGAKGVTRTLPLAEAGITAADVGRFWKQNDFDLALPNHGGKTFHGNCDLCFLKGADQILSLIREKPSRALWWMKMENSITNAAIENGGLFRSDRPSYAAMHKMATDHGELFAFDDEALEDCYCG